MLSLFGKLRLKFALFDVVCVYFQSTLDVTDDSFLLQTLVVIFLAVSFMASSREYSKDTKISHM